MHPGMMGWWAKNRHGHDGGCGASAHPGCGPSHGWGGGGHEHGFHRAAGGDDEGASLGVRRPLRFLAWKLELEEPQVAELAKILADLKLERAQAHVDTRRSLSAFADAMSAEAFDQEKVTEAASGRVRTAERLRDAVVVALRRIHAMLDPEQRERFAYLLRTGALTI